MLPQAARAEHGCCFGKVQEHRSYTPYRMVRWDEGVLTVRKQYGKTFDAVRALRQTSVRYTTPAPAVVPLKQPFLTLASDPQPASKRAKTGHPSSTAGGADEVQGSARDAVLRMGEAVLASEGFAGTGTPYLQSVKVRGGSLFIAGKFHCKIAGRYHHSNRQYLCVRPSGTITQHCYHGDCLRKSAPCGRRDVDAAWFAEAGH